MTVLGYETVFDTANRTMTHVFHERLQITLNFRDFEIIIMKDGEIIQRLDIKGQPFSLNDYEDMLNHAAKAVEKLNMFK
jgi:hypothetical protein